MSCHDARESFSALVDEALAHGERAALDAHLDGCADCRRELDRFRRTVALLRGVDPAQVPAGFVDRVLAATRPTPWPRRLARRLFLPLPVKLPIEAAAVVLIALSAVYVYQRSPEIRQAARLEAPVPEPLRPAEVPRPAEAPRLTEVPPPTPPAAPPPAASRTVPRASPPAKKDQARATESREALSRAAPTLPTPKVAEPAAPRSRPEAPGSSGAPETTEPRPLAKAPLLGVAPAPAAPGAAPAEEKAERPPTASVHRFAARALVSVDVSGRLRVKDPQAAATGLAELVARLGGAQLARRPDPGAPAGELVELLVPRAAYLEFTAGLGRLGEWRVETEAAALPEEIRAVVRLID